MKYNIEAIKYESASLSHRCFGPKVRKNYLQLTHDEKLKSSGRGSKKYLWVTKINQGTQENDLENSSQ